MYLIKGITKKSIRENELDKKFVIFYSLKKFKPGQMIEIIEGNKKNPLIILKIDELKKYKEKIRKKEIEIKKLKLSKSGKWAGGKEIDFFDLELIKKILKNPFEIEKIGNKNLLNFFPKKRRKKTISKTEQKEKETFSTISFNEKILKKEKKYYNQTQEMIDTIRKYFKENSRYGYGSFSYYIGISKKIPLEIIWQFFSEAKQSRKNLEGQKRLFWYKIGQYLKNKKTD